MLKTLDGFTCKRGEIVYEIGVTTKGIYSPLRVKVHSRSASYCIINEDRIWKSYDNCKAECEKMNNERFNWLIQTESEKIIFKQPS